MRTACKLARFLRYAIWGDSTRPKRVIRRRRIPRGPARDPKYRAWIRTLPCLVCHRWGDSEAAHTGSDGGMGIKASDYSCLPICPEHHTWSTASYHVMGRERFEMFYGLDLAEKVEFFNELYRAQNEIALDGGPEHA